MATADSIFAEGGNNNNNEMQAIVHDDDIITEINQTAGHEQIAESVEMVDRKNVGENRRQPPELVEKDGKPKIVTILMVVSIIYSVIISTIALIIAIVALNNNASTAPIPSPCDCTLNNLAAKTDATIFCSIIDVCFDTSTYPTISPTISPTNLPTINMTPNPSTSSPTMEPTNLPSVQPTIEPTLQPTYSPTYFDGYFIGDFKLSLKNSDHGFWRLCNGKKYRTDGEYSLLFQEIGFMFGSYNVTMANITHEYFQIPNTSDSVIGIAGNSHLIGEEIGDEGVVLTNNNIPSHTHKVISWAQSSDGTSNYDDRSICQNGYLGNYQLNHCPLADGWATGYQYQYGNNPVSVMQPTTFISNLFIYTGVSL